jgi:energy-converting hydrogenase Eha subunit F
MSSNLLKSLLKVEPLPAVFIIALAALIVVGLAVSKIPAH